MPPALGGCNGWALVGVDRSDRAEPWSVKVRPTVDDVTLDLPTSLVVGATAGVTASATNGGRTVELVYPVSVDWSSGSGHGLAIGPPGSGRRHRAVAELDPATRTLTALRPGPVTLRLAVNATTVERSLTITR